MSNHFNNLFDAVSYAETVEKPIRWHSNSNPYEGRGYGDTGLELLLKRNKKKSGLALLTQGGATEEEKQERRQRAKAQIATGYALPPYSAAVQKKADEGLKKYPILRILGGKNLTEMKAMGQIKNKSSVQLTEMEGYMKAVASSTKGVNTKRTKEKRLVAAVNLKLLAEMKSQEEENAARNAKAQSQGYENWQEADAVNMVKFEWYSKVYQLVRTDGGSDLDVLSIPALEAAEKQLFGITSYDARKAGQEPNLLTPSQVQQILRGEQLQLEQAKQEIIQVKEQKESQNRLLLTGGIVVGVAVLGVVLWKTLK